MKRACIAVVDALRARLLVFDEDAPPGDQMIELTDLANAGRRLKQSDLFSEPRPPVRAEADQTVGHGTDDHRDAHESEWDQQFAKLVIAEIARVVRERREPNVIVVASPKMLGALRKVDGVLHRADLVVDEVTQDLAGLSASQIHDKLARMRLIPPRSRLSFAQR